MLSKLKIDINADVGEGIGNEHLLMPFLSSCNIACGGHAGDVHTMRSVARLAKIYNVKIGAHPSFPDKANFGRKVIDISNTDLLESLKTQINNLNSVLNAEGLKLRHIKPHGALYNLAAKDETTASVVLDVFQSIPENVKLYAPYNSVISKVAQSRNIEVAFEGFADRNYNEDLSLVSRQNKDALITKKEIVFEHVFRMISEQKIKAFNGVEVKLNVDTVCVHGDTKNAIKILKYLRENLMTNYIEIV